MSWDEKEQAKKIREEYNIRYNNYILRFCKKFDYFV